MGAPRPADLLSDTEWLNRRLGAGGVWAGGRVGSIGTQRIGTGYGLSGEIHRLHLAAETHDHATIVAKIDDRALIGRAVAAHRLIGAGLERNKPTLLGHDLDTLADLGVLLLEDVRPAAQGDELEPIGRESAAGLVSVVARLHRTPLERAGEVGIETWTPRQPNPERWDELLARLSPQLDRRFGRGWQPRLERLDDEATTMSALLAEHPFVLVHGDPHLDNVLWRPDGSTVLLDWSSVRLGPAALDLAILLSSLCFTEQPALDPQEVIDRLADPADPAPTESARAALTNLIRGQLGWAGRPDAAAAHPRVEALLHDAFGRIEREIAWIDLGVVSGRSRR